MINDESLEPIERFQNFLRSFLSEEGAPIYRQRISQMAIRGSRSLIIDFEDLLTFDEPLARDLIEDPEKYLKYADDAAWNQLKIEDPEYAEKIKNVRTRFRGLPEAVPLRAIGSEHIKKLIMVNGILVRATPVQPMLVRGAFRCRRCGKISYVEQTGVFVRAPTVCSNPACRRAGPFDFVEEESTFIDSQRIRIQERPEDLPPGQLPRWIDVRLVEDIVNKARPGDRVSIVGIVMPVQQFLSRGGRLRTFNLRIDANFIEVAGKEEEMVQISPEEERKILDLAKDPMIHQKIIRSIAPSIYGYEDLKEAIMLLLFGGVPKRLPDGINIRGDANVLFIGDPGTAKSQLLQYVAKIAPRGLYTSGRGSTAAGLTAAVLRERGGGMVLEAGALVLSDKGVCCIDEIDKMRPEDRVAIHEAMEQRSYHPSFEILLANGVRMSIGKFVNALFETHHHKTVIGKDCEVLPVHDLQIEILTTDFKKIYPVVVSHVSRHLAPKYFVKIVCSNGREVIVTPDHPVFVFRSGLSTIRAEDVQVGDFVPGVRTLPLKVNTEPLKQAPQLHPNEKRISTPYIYDPNLSRILGYFASEGHSYVGSSAEIGFSNTDPMIIKDMKNLMGSTFQTSPIDYVEKNRTQRYISTRLYRFFKANFPEFLRRANRKRVSCRILSADKSLIREFLKAAFKGDGSVETGALCYRTASKGLAYDYQDLLLRLGIQSRIVTDRFNDSYKVYITGDCLEKFAKEIIDQHDPRHEKIQAILHKSMRGLRHHDVLPTYFAKKIICLLKELGISYDGYFYKHLKCNHGITIDTIKKYIQILEKRVYEIEKLSSQIRDFKNLRLFLGWSQHHVAEKLKTKRGVVDYVERNGYSASKRKNLTEELRKAAVQATANVKKEISWIKSFIDSEIRWLRVRRVEVIPNKGIYATKWTYDVTVAPNQTFVSQGLVLHNTVSVAKGGIVATLNARSSILAAANPALGRYDPYRTIAENLSLPITLLSRFDLIFVIRDQPNRDVDSKMAEHILTIHRTGEPSVKPPIPPDLLRKYISYAKDIKPVLTQEAIERLRDFYLSMRSISESSDSPVAITARQLESLVRLAEARARSALRREVTVEDAEAAILLMKKSLQQVGIDVESGRYDIDVIMTGKPKSLRDKLQVVLSTIVEMERATGMVKEDDLYDRLQSDFKMSRIEAIKLVSQLVKEGTIYSPKPKYLKKA